MLSRGIDMPRMIYGTAWKKDRTKELVISAIKAGFRAIDTAGQPKHYNEKLAGEAVTELIDQGFITREQVFIQTKFSPMSRSDATNHGCPYDYNAPIKEQVFQSFQASLSNFRTDYIDSYVLHGPYGSNEHNAEVWKAFEQLVEEKKVKRIGLSNVYSFDEFKFFWSIAKIKPSVLQNRFYDEGAYDLQFRDVCKNHNVTFQSFWTLTGNPDLLKFISRHTLKPKDSTSEQLLYKFVQQLGIVPLNGTTSAEHMKLDLEVENLPELPTELFNELCAYLER